ncbi:uncharacterized protein ACRADG_000702 [Cochliomyia hominivorax]
MCTEKTLKTSRGFIIYSVIEFLKEIGNRPVIWYKEDINRTNRLMAWHDVIRCFVPYFDDLSIDEQNELFLYFRKNWKNITNALMKSIKFIDEPNYRPYRYAKYLEFYLNNRGITLDDVGTPEQFRQIDEMEKIHEEQTKRKYKKQDVKENDANHSEEQNNHQTKGTNPYQTTYEQGETVYESSNTNISYSTTEDIDADQDFFDSIKPILKKFNDDQLLDFEIEFLDILKKYHLQNV